MVKIRINYTDDADDIAMVKFLPAHASAHVLCRVSRYHAAETHRH
jgi:hypothetical protein